LAFVGAFSISSEFVGQPLLHPRGMVARRDLVPGGRGTVLPSSSFCGPIFLHAKPDRFSFLCHSCSTLSRNARAYIDGQVCPCHIPADAIPRRRAGVRYARRNLLARPRVSRVVGSEQRRLVWRVGTTLGGNVCPEDLVPKPRQVSYPNTRLFLDRTLLLVATFDCVDG